MKGRSTEEAIALADEACRRRRERKERADMVCTLAAQGLGVGAIAQRLRVGETFVRRWVRACGIRPPGRGHTDILPVP